MACSWNELRLNNQLCDGAIKTQDGFSFPIHRVILSAFSPYFRAYFTNSLNNGQPEFTEMLVTDVPSSVLRSIIEFAYTQHCQVTHENVYSIMVAADKLSCDSLVQFCTDFISPNICDANCIRIMKFSQNFFFRDLEEKALQCACEQMESVINMPDFQSLTVEELTELLATDYLNVRREETVFEAISRWVLEDPDARRHHITNLLPCVRFGSISTDYYFKTIKRFPHYTQESRDFLQSVDYLFDKSEDSCSYRYCNIRPRVPDEVIFSIGGWCEGHPTDAVETYDKRSDSWYLSEIRDPRIRAYHGVVVLDNLIYVIGGFDGTNYYNTMHCFDPVTYRWSERACMHDSRCYVSVCVLDKEIYAVGGFNGKARLKSAERYNPMHNQWTHIATMNQLRSDANAAALDKKVYVTGGFNGHAVLNSVERYCPVKNQWDYVDSLSTPRSGVGLIAHGSYIYALGGFDGVHRLNTVERYNPKHNRWDLLADMQCSRSNMAAVILQNSIYVLGGFNAGQSTIRSTEMYDEEQNAWFELASMNLNRSALSACVCRGLPNTRSYTYYGVTDNGSII